MKTNYLLVFPNRYLTNEMCRNLYFHIELFRVSDYIISDIEVINDLAICDHNKAVDEVTHFVWGAIDDVMAKALAERRLFEPFFCFFLV